tara:strand:- start:154 stop:357 length:204 start_codon:yes stop_codon:yes gene_type:complete
MTQQRKERINQRLFNKTETAKYLGVSVPTLNKLLREDKVPQAIKLSEGRWAWDLKKLEKWIEESQEV